MDIRDCGGHGAGVVVAAGSHGVAVAMTIMEFKDLSSSAT